MSKHRKPESVTRLGTSECLKRLQMTFDAGDYVKVRQLAQKLKKSDPSQAATAQSWIERTQNDSALAWFALPVGLLIVVAIVVLAG